MYLSGHGDEKYFSLGTAWTRMAGRRRLLFDQRKDGRIFVGAFEIGFHFGLSIRDSSNQNVSCSSSRD
jgi:hypothetical protein